MWQTELEKLIADLNIAADSVSSQSLSDIQTLLRKAAKTIAELKQEVGMLEVDTDPNHPYDFTWKDVN